MLSMRVRRRTGSWSGVCTVDQGMFLWMYPNYSTSVVQGFCIGFWISTVHDARSVAVLVDSYLLVLVLWNGEECFVKCGKGRNARRHHCFWPVSNIMWSGPECHYFPEYMLLYIISYATAWYYWFIVILGLSNTFHSKALNISITCNRRSLRPMEIAHDIASTVSINTKHNPSTCRDPHLSEEHQRPWTIFETC